MNVIKHGFKLRDGGWVGVGKRVEPSFLLTGTINAPLNAEALKRAG